MLGSSNASRVIYVCILTTDVQGELGMAPIPQIAGQRPMKAALIKRLRGQAGCSDGKITPTATPWAGIRSVPKRLKDAERSRAG